ncbi:MAG: hypothetical protein ACYTEX_26280 [Planctomycetota bacterium]
MNKGGQMTTPVLGLITALAFSVAVAQAAEPIHIPPVLWEFVRGALVLLVGIIAWYARGIYRDQSKDMERLRKDVHRLELKLNTLETMCPFHGALQARAGESAQPLRKAVNDGIGSET